MVYKIPLSSHPFKINLTHLDYQFSLCVQGWFKPCFCVFLCVKIRLWKWDINTSAVLGFLLFCFPQDGVMVLSATHRYKKKYVTTLLYKPIWKVFFIPENQQTSWAAGAWLLVVLITWEDEGEFGANVSCFLFISWLLVLLFHTELTQTELNVLSWAGNDGKSWVRTQKLLYRPLRSWFYNWKILFKLNNANL